MNNAQKSSEVEQPRKKMMLVIDDDSLVLESCRRILKDEGYEVSTADNPREGIAIAIKSSFDVILCDWRMPEMKGIEVVEILGKQCHDSAIIMITRLLPLRRSVDVIKIFFSILFSFSL